MIIRPLVTKERFGEISCMDSSVFGVKTSCNSCEDALAPCLRRSLAEKLIENQRLAENELGYALSEQYHVEEIRWNGNNRYALKYKGVSDINVAQSETSLGSDFSVSPYLFENVAVSTVDEFHIVTIDGDMVDNPGNILIRNSATGGVILQDGNAKSYPQRNGSGDWLIAIDTPNDDVPLVDIQDCKYFAVSVPTFDTDGEIIAVHPGTNEYIPFAKEPIVIGGNTIYWFYCWSLIDPSFRMDDEIDLLAGQFYKVMQKIGFVSLTEISAPAKIIWSDLSETTDDLTAKQYLDNIVRIDRLTNSCISTPDCSDIHPIKIVIYYKTDPELLGINTDSISDAIAALSASMLPFTSCGCEAPKTGYIYTMQKPYADIKINQVTGDTFSPVKFGNRHGEMYFWSIISREKSPRNRKAIRI